MTIDEEREYAQKVGSKALKSYMEIEDKFDKGHITEEELYKNLDKEVYEPVIKAGYEWLSRGWSSNSGNPIYDIIFGRELSDYETEIRGGEEWVQEWRMSSDSDQIEDENEWWR